MNLINANEKRADNHLASAIRYNGNVMTVREWIDALIAQGYKPNAKAVKKPAACRCTVGITASKPST